jgi:hypothetical protein
VTEIVPVVLEQEKITQTQRDTADGAADSSSAPSIRLARQNDLGDLDGTGIA